MHTGRVMIQEQPTMDSTGVSPTCTVPVTATRVLGVSQIVIGTITCIFGIAVLVALKNYWVGDYGLGIWGGIWVCIANFLLYISIKMVFHAIFEKYLIYIRLRF